jgi:hypothetical protein
MSCTRIDAATRARAAEGCAALCPLSVTINEHEDREDVDGRACRCVAAQPSAARFDRVDDARRSGTLASDVVTFALPREAGLSTENAAQL